MAKKPSVAPKERVNITYKSALGDAKEELELPFRMLVLGDFTQRADDRLLEDRDPISVNKDNFNNVMREQALEIDVAVPNVLSGEEGDEISAKLNFESIKDFQPDRVAEQVPELKKILDIRNALAALKGPLGNMRQFRKQLEDTLNDPAMVEKFMAVVNQDDQGASRAPDAGEVAGDGPATSPEPPAEGGDA